MGSHCQSILGRYWADKVLGYATETVTECKLLILPAGGTPRTIQPKHWGRENGRRWQTRLLDLVLLAAACVGYRSAS